MISLLEIAQSINEAEVDDDKIVKYKDKDGESAEMKAGSAKTMEKDHPAKIAWDKMQDDGGDDKKDSGGKLAGSDFDRDSGGDDNVKSDDEEISDANSGPIDTDDIMDMLKKDPEVVDKMGDDVYWDGMDLVSSKFDDDTIASIPDDSNMTLGDLKKQIMDYEGEEDDENEFSGPNPDDSENLEDAEETVTYYEDELNHHQERLQAAQDVLDDALKDPENAKDDIKRAKEAIAKHKQGIKINTSKLKDANKKVKSFGGDDFNQDIIDPQGVDAIEAGEARDYIESNDLDADGIQNMWDSLQAKGYKYYNNYYRDVGKDIQRRIDYLKDGKGSDGFPMTSDVAEMKDKAKIGKLMQVFTKQHPLKKSDKKSESIKVIDGKKYKAIKESKKNPRILKEIYDRTFRSLK